MVGRVSRPPTHLSNFHYGTKAERREEISRGKRVMDFRSRDLRGRSRSRSKGLPPQDNSLTSFPPLTSFAGDDKEVGTQNAVGWNSLFKDPKKVRKGRILSFFKPLPHELDELPFVLLSEEAVQREVKQWEKCLVAYVVGKMPFFQALKVRMEAQWNLRGSFQMNSLPGGFFMFRFNEERDRNRVLWEGPWNFFGRPIVVKEWSMDLELKKDSFNSLPIWIRLPHLDFRLWDSETIGKIASVVGHPRFVDDATADRERLAFARACVEITPNCDFPSSVNILIGSKRWEQAIHYEWRPLSCSRCNTFEHSEAKCNGGVNIGEENSDRQGDHLHEDPRNAWKTVSRRTWVNLEGRSENQVNLNPPASTWSEKIQSINEHGTSSNAFQLLQQEEPADVLFVGPHEPRLEGKNQPVQTSCISNGEISIHDGNVHKKGQAVSEVEKVGKNPFDFEKGENSDTANEEDEEDPQSFAHEILGKEVDVVEMAALPTCMTEQPCTQEIGCTPVSAKKLGADFGPTGLEVAINLVAQLGQNGTEMAETQIEDQRVDESGLAGNLEVDDDGLLTSFVQVSEDEESSSVPETPLFKDKQLDAVGDSIPQPPFSPCHPSLNATLPMTKPITHSPSSSQPSVTHSPSLSKPIKPNSCSSKSQAQKQLRTSTHLSSNSSPDHIFDGSDESSDDSDLVFPPGFMPTQEDMIELRSLMKEGASLVPLEHQREFLESVDNEEDGEIVAFFKAKFNDPKPDLADTNYLTHQNLRRSPRLKKRPSKLADSANSSGLKKGFLK